MRIYAVVLNSNGGSYLHFCLDKLVHMKINKEDIFQIVVVDNGSSDESVKILEKNYPDCTIIKNDTNLGYAEGNNVGIRYAQNHNADFVWIVSPEIVPSEDSLLRLVSAADTYKDAGIFGSKIYYFPGHEVEKERFEKEELGKILWYAGGEIDWDNVHFTNRGIDQSDKGQFDLDEDTEWITGGNMFIRAKILDEIGLIDPRYFFFFEEGDLCQRAKRRGWRLKYIHASIAWRLGNQIQSLNTSLQDYYLTRNRLLFGFKFAPFKTQLALAKESFKVYLSGRPWQRRGILDYFTGNMGKGSYETS